MIRHLPLAACICLLSACNTMQNVKQHATEDLQENAQRVGQKVKEAFTYYPPQRARLQPVPERYCYKVTQDVLCYSHAIPGAEGRLVAYQGNVEVPPEPIVEARMWWDEDKPKDASAAAEPVQTVADKMTGAAPAQGVGSGYEALDARKFDPNSSPASMAASAPRAGSNGLKPLRSVTVGAPPRIAAAE